MSAELNFPSFIPLKFLPEYHNCIFPSEFQGAGAFEVAARQHLVNEVKKTVQGV